MRTVFMALLVSAIALSGMEESARAATISIRSSTLEMRGTIDAGDAEAFERALTDDIQLVQVRSPGGLLLEAMRIGKTLKAKQLNVEIVGLCASACAQLILPGAHILKIKDGSVIAMHAAAEGAFLSAQREGGLLNLPNAARQVLLGTLGSLRDEMTAYFDATGVNRNSMNFMYLLTSTSQVEVAYKEESAGNFAFQLQGQRDPLCRAWLLDAESLASFGVKADRWESAGRLWASFVLGEKYDQIYDGPVRQESELGAVKDCAALRRLPRLHAAAQ
ncbi:hypothetical protein [Paucibacter sp. Y2R2-4]|uniref:hypothetical protein n=1 Tax=Paucibacter sp. Y2R2-4 TaxID=2893553 RepID=UPI0021E3EC87|nr:hypothetical protein [Paucibacter sp. Y2R2-4]MCV2351449.1 hypothetical protein [Paucibacter sp. Y2R2-4]